MKIAVDKGCYPGKVPRYREGMFLVDENDVLLYTAVRYCGDDDISIVTFPQGQIMHVVQRGNDVESCYRVLTVSKIDIT